MATPMTADRLVTALRAEGLTVVEVDGWRTNNRNHKGPWGPVNGVMVHHTVTSGVVSSVNLCYNGHSALPGPLCHGVIDKQGVVHLVGNGRANHAGSGDGDVLTAVQNETPLPADNEADTDGNRYFYGFEAINLGDGKDPWPEVQLEAIEKAAAAICRVHQWSERSVIGHLEWQPGKVDPRGFTMTSMRTRIADRIEITTTPTPAPTPAPTVPEDDMDFTSLACAKPFAILPGEDKAIYWTAEYQDGAGDHPDGSRIILTGNHYTGTASVSFNADVPAGVFVRMVQEYGDGGSSGEPAQELAAGSRMHSVSVTGRVPADRALVLKVENNSDREVFLTWSGVRLLTWAL